MATLIQPSSSPQPAVSVVARNLAAITSRIGAAATGAGRDPAGITVIGVSKTVPLERLCGIGGSGLTDLGENRVQEAEPKVAALGDAVTWHLIGHLQRNKSKVAVRLFDLIHSVDSVELAADLDRHAAAIGKRQRILLQVNIAEEASKSGFAVAELRAVAARLAGLAHLQPEGLMTIAPLGADDAELRAVFGALRELRDDLAATFIGGAWRHLSMGMSDDFEIAVAEGATLVRVGRAIFGERAQAMAGV